MSRPFTHPRHRHKAFYHGVIYDIRYEQPRDNPPHTLHAPIFSILYDADGDTEDINWLQVHRHLLPLTARPRLSPTEIQRLRLEHPTYSAPPPAPDSPPPPAPPPDPQFALCLHLPSPTTTTQSTLAAPALATMYDKPMLSSTLPFIGERISLHNRTYVVQDFTPSTASTSAHWLLASGALSITLPFHTFLRYWIMSRQSHPSLTGANSAPIGNPPLSPTAHIDLANPLANVPSLIGQPLPPLELFAHPSPPPGEMAAPSPQGEEGGDPACEDPFRVPAPD